MKDAYEGATPVVTSVAALNLPYDPEVISITGNTNITSINASGFQNRTVRLIFTGTSTVVDGSNLKLNGNFVATADDVLSLTCDGVNWYEVARSAN